MKMRLLLLWISWLQVSGVLAQVEMSMPNADSVVNTYYSNGNLRHHLEFSKGRRILIRFYLSDGKLGMRDSLVGEMNYHVHYHPDGSLREKGTFKNDTKYGEWIAYHSNGQLNYIDHFNETGEREGAYISYYSNGQLEERSFRKAGELVGDLWSYYENGQLEQHYFFYEEETGKSDSTLRLNESYYANGQLKMWVRAQYGAWIDTLYAYHENGRLSLKQFNFNGKPEGMRICYFADGSIQDSVRYENGLKQGRYVRYFENGQVAERGNYVDDQCDSLHETWYENGLLASRKYYVDLKPDGDWFEYYDNGKLKSTQRYYAQHKEGEWTEYYWDGTLKSSKIYRADTLQGRFIEFYSNGQLRIEGEAVDDELIGTYKTYFENGQVETVRIIHPTGGYSFWHYFENGILESKGGFNGYSQRTGTWYWYAEDGSRTKKRVSFADFTVHC